jgi:hypothetical protein
MDECAELECVVFLNGAGSMLKATMVRTTDCYAVEEQKCFEITPSAADKADRQLYKSRQTEWSGAQQIVGCNVAPSDRVERNELSPQIEWSAAQQRVGCKAESRLYSRETE